MPKEDFGIIGIIDKDHKPTLLNELLKEASVVGKISMPKIIVLKLFYCTSIAILLTLPGMGEATRR